MTLGGRIRWGAAAVAAFFILLACGQAVAGSPNVAALQAALKAKGLYGAEVDGVRGPVTRSALMRFQRRARLTVDGVAGPQTRRALGRRGRPALGRRVLTMSRVGWDVAELQFLLWRRGFSPGPIDGAFGAGTARAVFAYQRSASISADGVAGPATVRALRRGAVDLPDSSVRFYRPVPGPLGDGFGHVGGRRHTGIDFPAGKGTPVKAGGRGVVLFAGANTGGYGNLVVVQHRLGFTTWYAHLSRIAAARGQSVAGESVIGYVGSTGRSTGPHLHFEVRRFDTPVDPMPYLLAGVARVSGHHEPEGHEPECSRAGPASAAAGPARFGRARLPGC